MFIILWELYNNADENCYYMPGTMLSVLHRSDLPLTQMLCSTYLLRPFRHEGMKALKAVQVVEALVKGLVQL